MTLSRLLFAVALVVMVGLIGYRLVQSAAINESREFAASPTERLRVAPLDGDAFAEIAVAGREGGDPATTMALHEIALRRAPRDLRVRAWLADFYLQARRYPEAIEQLDLILRLSAAAQRDLLPLMAQWANDPAFADALVAKLRHEPGWSRAMIATFRSNIRQPGAAAVFAALSGEEVLGEQEVARWLDALIRAGNAGLAYSYWVSGLNRAPGTPLPMLYNGGFEQAPTQMGFDWRTERWPGTYTEFEAAEGAKGNAAHMVFHGRPVEAANLEQVLALAPGRYRVSMRAKAMALRSDQGLHWIILCQRQGQGPSKPLATGERLEGSFSWRETSIEFDIPSVGCPGQWLRLTNPAPRGSARIVSGELWIDDMVLRPTARSAGNARL